MVLLDALAAWFADPAHWAGPNGIPTRLLEHVALSGISMLIAGAIALPLGLWIGHTGRGATVAINAANLGRAIPSLALIGLAAPITAAFDPQLGFRVYPTLIAMIVLALPPILVNASAGVSEVDRDLVEAARGMGMRERQVLARVEIPIALPVILAGLRSAGVQIVATLTLGAIFGGGGLGNYLVLGIAQNDVGQVFGGVVLVAALALLVEGGFALLGRALTPVPLRAAEGGEHRGRALEGRAAG